MGRVVNGQNVSLPEPIFGEMKLIQHDIADDTVQCCNKRYDTYLTTTNCPTPRFVNPAWIMSYQIIFIC